MLTATAALVASLLAVWPASRVVYAGELAPQHGESVRCNFARAFDQKILVTKCHYPKTTVTGWEAYEGAGMQNTGGSYTGSVRCPASGVGFPGGAPGRGVSMWVGEGTSPWGDIPDGGFICATQHGYPLGDGWQNSTGLSWQVNGLRPNSVSSGVSWTCTGGTAITACPDAGYYAGDPSTMDFPDSWFPGVTGPAPEPCEGMQFLMYQDDGDGWDLMTNPLHPTYTGDEDYRYRLGVRFAQPSSGQETEQVDLFFQSDTRYSSGINLGRYPNPQAVEDSARIWLFDVTAEFLSLEQPDWTFEFMRVACWSEHGQRNWGGTSASATDGDGTPWIGEPPEVPTSSDDCFTLSGMSLTNPVSWVTGIGKMAVCLVTWFLVPSGDGLSQRITTLTDIMEDPPFQWVTASVEYVGGTSFTFATWADAGPACFTIMETEVCPRTWDNGQAPTWVVSLMAFALWLVVLVGVWRFF